MNSTKNQIFANYFFLFLSIVLIVFTIIFSANNQTISKKIITIEKGKNLNEIIDLFYREELVKNKFVFKSFIYFRNLQKKIPAGTYLFQGQISNSSIINTIFSNGQISKIITIPEGSSTKKVVDIILSEFDFELSEVELLKDKKFLESIGIQSSSIDGYLFPDSYFFHYDDSFKLIIQKIVNEFEIRVLPLYNQNQIKEMTLHEILTLASIVEGEAMIDDERAIIASVYINRLKKNMKLQADPTIQFIVDGSPKRLTSRDLKIESPYNTYLNFGLPPGPINNPGLKSIHAVLNPEKTDYLFFVAKGDGSHVFTKNEKDHNEAKKNYKKFLRNQ